jgi:hypothetical protein
MCDSIRSARLILLALTFAMAACFSLSRPTPPLEQYVLGGTLAAQGTAASRDSAGFAIGLRRLDLARYLRTPAIVVRRGAHQIVVSEYRRWGEDPAEGISRAVARYLADDPNVRAVDVAPWQIGARQDYLIQLHVMRFEGVAPADSAATEGEVQLLASWEIIGPLDGTVLARGTTDYREAGWTVGDYAGLVTLLDRGVTTLSNDLVACLARLAASTQAGAVGCPAAPE